MNPNRTPALSMTPLLLAVLAAIAALAAGDGHAQTQPSARVQAKPATLDCMIQPNQIVQVGTAVSGVVERISVERGDTVVRGQVLVQLSAGVERASLALQVAAQVRNKAVEAYQEIFRMQV